MFSTFTLTFPYKSSNGSSSVCQFGLLSEKVDISQIRPFHYLLTLNRTSFFQCSSLLSFFLNYFCYYCKNINSRLEHKLLILSIFVCCYCVLSLLMVICCYGVLSILVSCKAPSYLGFLAGF